MPNHTCSVKVATVRCTYTRTVVSVWNACARPIVVRDRETVAPFGRYLNYKSIRTRAGNTVASPTKPKNAPRFYILADARAAVRIAPLGAHHTRSHPRNYDRVIPAGCLTHCKLVTGILEGAHVH